MSLGSIAEPGPAVAAAEDRAGGLPPPATALGVGSGVVVRRLAKRFGPVQALDRVDLEVPPGRVTALVGRNGAGKSTLLRVLATAVLPDEGTASVGGRDVATDAVGARRRLGLVLGDDRSFFWRLTGRQNLEFFARVHGLRRSAVRQRVEAALDAVALGEVAGRRVDGYSTGMRSRLGIARALLGEPSVLLLDEPTRSLDPATTDGVRGLVRGLADEHGAAVLLVTHDLAEAVAVADEVVVLRAGRVAASIAAPIDVAAVHEALAGVA